MANYIANSIFEEIESPLVNHNWDNVNFNINKQNEKDYDDGSVSSGSEKGDEGQFNVPKTHKKRYCRQYEKTKSYTNDVGSALVNFPSSGIKSSSKVHQPQSRFSSELNEIGQEIK